VAHTNDTGSCRIKLYDAKYQQHSTVFTQFQVIGAWNTDTIQLPASCQVEDIIITIGQEEAKRSVGADGKMNSDHTWMAYSRSEGKWIMLTSLTIEATPEVKEVNLEVSVMCDGKRYRYNDFEWEKWHIPPPKLFLIYQETRTLIRQQAP